MGTRASMREVAHPGLERQRRPLVVGQPALPRQREQAVGPQHGERSARGIERVATAGLERDAPSRPGDEMVADAGRHVRLARAEDVQPPLQVRPPRRDDDGVEPARVVEADEIATRRRQPLGTLDAHPHVRRGQPLEAESHEVIDEAARPAAAAAGGAAARAPPSWGSARDPDPRHDGQVAVEERGRRQRDRRRHARLEPLGLLDEQRHERRVELRYRRSGGAPPPPPGGSSRPGTAGRGR